jgi:HlyD family secretion protein
VVQNVVTYDAVIDFENPAMRLFPGMTAYVTIPIASVHDALKLPNAALRYKPPLDPEEIRALYRQYHVDAGESQATSGAGTGQAPAPRAARAESAIVWKRHADNTLEPVKVALGITDHAFTQITSVITGQLKEGDELVTRSVAAKAPPPAGQAVRR